MTKITAFNDGIHYKIEAVDHAGDSRTCAGISALMYALAGSLSNSEYVRDLDIDFDDAHALIEFDSYSLFDREDVQVILIGLMQIELSDPEHVSIDQNIFTSTSV